jgi:hypothetical protein
MTPKEKAKELVDKFHRFTYTSVHAYKTSGEYSDTIKCALICVDEILKSNPTKIDCNSSELNYKYWIEVKDEINKL